MVNRLPDAVSREDPKNFQIDDFLLFLEEKFPPLEFGAPFF